LTKETAAEAYGRELVFDEEAYDEIVKYFAASNRTPAPNNKKQAYIPEGSIKIENHNGTAPGCIIEDGDCCAVLLPGPPRELEPMFTESVLPYLIRHSGMAMKSRVLRMFGIGESDASMILDDLIKNQTNPTIAPYAKEGEVTFRITASAESESECESLLDKTVNEVYTRLGKYIYAEGDDNSLAKTVVNNLLAKKLTLATVESCTGGTIGQMITSVPGSSEVYGFGFVTYANEAKERLVGVKRETLLAHGAVSEETAREMAEGARRVSGADIAVSVTGIAGPGGGTSEKPVGLVYIGVSDGCGTSVIKLNAAGNRDRVRQKSALTALFAVNEAIKKHKEK